MHTNVSMRLRPFFQAVYLLGILLLMTLAAPLFADPGGPVLSAALTPSNVLVTGGPIVVTANVKDPNNAAITSVTASLYKDGSYDGAIYLSNGGTGSIYTGTFGGVGTNTTVAPLIYTAVVTATNATNLSNSVATAQISQANDDTPPTITSTKLSPTNLPVTGGSITVTATVNDPNSRAVTSVSASLYKNGNYDGAIYLSNGGTGSIYTGTFGGSNNNTTSADYSFTAAVTATNDLGLTNTASVAGSTVQSHDNLAPTLTNLTISPAYLPVTGGGITLTATVNDPGGRAVTSVSGSLYKNGNYDGAIYLSNGGVGNIYTGTFGVGSNTSNVPNIYTASASATNDLGLSNTAVNDGQTGQGNNGSPGSLVPMLFTSDPAKPILSPASLPAGSPDTVLTITGVNFASDAEVSINGVLLASSLITSASSTQITITVPAALLTHPGALAVCVISPSLGSLSNGVNLEVEAGNGTMTYTKLTGTAFGTTGSYNNDGLTFGNALDSNLNTYFDAPAPGSGDYVGIDLGAGHASVVTRIGYCPRAGYPSRMVGGVFQGSNDASTWTALYTVTAAPSPGVLTRTTAISSGTAYRYLRYLAPNGSYGNVAEVEFDTSP